MKLSNNIDFDIVYVRTPVVPLILVKKEKGVRCLSFNGSEDLSSLKV